MEITLVIHDGTSSIRNIYYEEYVMQLTLSVRKVVYGIKQNLEQCAGDHPPDELGRVVEGPPELDLGGVARHAAHDVHPLVLGHAVDHGLGCCTNRNI